MKALIVWMIVLVSGCLSGVELTAVSPEDILFLAHFDQRVEPDIGNFQGAYHTAKLSSGTKGFPFLNGARQEALDLCRGKKVYLLPAKQNFDPEKGTLQMWVLPRWTAGYAHCVFFQLVPFAEKRDVFNWREMHMQKIPENEAVTCGPRGKKIQLPVEGGKDGWFQLAVTWDNAAAERCFYINGKLQERSRYVQKCKPYGIMLGGPRTWNAQSFVDEIRILRRVLTPAEIRSDYLAQMEGKRFSIPKETEKPDLSFEVVPLTSKEENTVAEPDAKDVFEAIAVSGDFPVDGNLDKKVWKKAKVINRLWNRNGKELPVRSEIRLLYSPNALYLGGSFRQDMERMTVQYDQHDLSIWNDDNLEVFLNIPGASGGFYQFAFNPIEVYADLKDGDRKYNAKGIAVKTRRFKDRWDLEVKIPFADLRLPRPFSGDFISARFCRAVRNPQSAGSIPRLKAPGNNQRGCLGKLLFSAGESDVLEICPARKSFAVGMNRFSVKLINRGKERFKGNLRIWELKQSGVRSLVNVLPVSMEPESEGCIELKAGVSCIDVSRLVLQAECGGREVAAAVLSSGFSYAPPGMVETERLVRRLRSSVEPLTGIEHPVYRGAVGSIVKMADAIEKFKSLTTAALSSGQTVPEQDVRTFAGQIAGFKRLVDDYRYLVWVTSPWEIGTPDALPKEDFRREISLNFQQAGNEREAVCLIFSGLLCGSRLDLRIVPQSVKGKTFISCDNFEVYTEPFTNHIGDVITAPLVRSPGNMITITPGKAVRVWIVFNSRHVPPGKYRTSLLLKPAYDYSIADRKIPVNLQVWNFALPETHEWPLASFLWGPNRFANDEVALLRLSHAYHITHGWTKGFQYTHGLQQDFQTRPLPEGKAFDENLAKYANQEFFRVARELNMKFVFGWNLPYDVRWYRLMAERLVKMGFRHEDFVFKALIADEFVRKHIPVHAAIREEIQKINPGWYFQAVYLSSPPPVGAMMDDIENAGLPEFYKMWTVIRHLLNDPQRGPEVIRRLRRKGCQVWSYNCQRYMQVQPVLEYYRFYAWECYMKGLDGMALWTVMSPSGDDGFDYRDGYDDGLVWRGFDKQPVPTKRLEAIREGLEDVAYMDRLRKELDRMKMKGKSYPEYESLLSVRGDIMKKASQNEVDLWRLKVGSAIDRLTAQRF